MTAARSGAPKSSPRRPTAVVETVPATRDEAGDADDSIATASVDPVQLGLVADDRRPGGNQPV
ncbi:MAG: hypothetical protein U5J78_03435 [Parasphingorhabdus sp.]|nr:hypothetical protein [Parasphingorhabdus sp.]